MTAAEELALSHAVYSAVAAEMPRENVDFRMGRRDGPPGDREVIVAPLTAMGCAWVPFLAARLESSLAKYGYVVTVAGEARSGDAEEQLAKSIAMSES